MKEVGLGLLRLTAALEDGGIAVEDAVGTAVEVGTTEVEAPVVKGDPKP